MFIEHLSLFSLVSQKGSQVKLVTWISSVTNPSKTTAKIEGKMSIPLLLSVVLGVAAVIWWMMKMMKVFISSQDKKYISYVTIFE